MSGSLTFCCPTLPRIYDTSVTLMHPQLQSQEHCAIMDILERRYYLLRSIIESLESILSQVTQPVIEQSERDRAEFKMLVGEHFQPEHLVFADKSHFNRLSLRRNYAWTTLQRGLCPVTKTRSLQMSIITFRSLLRYPLFYQI